MHKARITYRNEILSNDVQKLILASESGYHKLAVTEISSALWETVVCAQLKSINSVYFNILTVFIFMYFYNLISAITITQKLAIKKRGIYYNIEHLYANMRPGKAKVHFYMNVKRNTFLTIRHFLSRQCI